MFITQGKIHSQEEELVEDYIEKETYSTEEGIKRVHRETSMQWK